MIKVYSDPSYIDRGMAKTIVDSGEAFAALGPLLPGGSPRHLLEDMRLSLMQSANPLLRALWRVDKVDADGPDRGKLDLLRARVGEDYRLVPLNECDVAILPGSECDSAGDVAAFLDQAEAAGKPVIGFGGGDHYTATNIKNGVMFRHSLDRATRLPNEYAMAAPVSDFVQLYFDGQAPIRDKQPRPVVGYCGYKAGKDIDAAANVGAAVRTKALRLLEGSPRVDTEFVYRKTYWDGAHGDVWRTGPPATTEELDRPVDTARMYEVRREYVDNMAASDYVFCCRGAGNYSFRFYETLSCGRIPLFVDTDCVLPFEDRINWRELCVWVDVADLDTIADALADFHDRISPEAFRARQWMCRHVWKSLLEPSAFYAAIADDLAAAIA